MGDGPGEYTMEVVPAMLFPIAEQPLSSWFSSCGSAIGETKVDNEDMFATEIRASQCLSVFVMGGSHIPTTALGGKGLR
jgi:hypothetical protein